MVRTLQARELYFSKNLTTDMFEFKCYVTTFGESFFRVTLLYMNYASERIMPVNRN